MVLIEGLGDEVTLVLGSFLLVIVLLLAWLSTHTDDIPLIREFGIIVVELRQRHRNRQIRTEQPQVNEISQSSRAGLASADPGNELDTSSPGEQTSNERESASDEQRTDTDSSPSVSLSESSSDVSASGQGKSSSDTNLPPGEERISPPENVSPIQQVSHEQRGTYSLHYDQRPQPVDITLPESAVTTPNNASTTETKEETLRRRRMQYFESGASSQPRDDNKVNGQQTDSCTDEKDNTRHNIGDSDIRQSDEGLRPSLDSTEVAQTDNSTPQQPILQGQADNEEEEVGEGDDSLGSQIRVKLKYVNETQRFVYASPDDTIGDFRRTHFQSELQDNKWVRFIFNGQDLKDDARTLQACNIENNCTMHCLVTARQRPGERQETVVEEEEESVLGTMMYPLFTLLLLVVWYFRIFYRQYFSAMSTLCLIGISFLLGLSYVSSLRTSDATVQPAAGQATTGSAEGRQNHPHSD